jgi:hypothetical protein
MNRAGMGANQRDFKCSLPSSVQEIIDGHHHPNTFVRTGSCRRGIPFTATNRLIAVRDGEQFLAGTADAANCAAAVRCKLLGGARSTRGADGQRMMCSPERRGSMR